LRLGVAGVSKLLPPRLPGGQVLIELALGGGESKEESPRQLVVQGGFVSGVTTRRATKASSAGSDALTATVEELRTSPYSNALLTCLLTLGGALGFLKKGDSLIYKLSRRRDTTPRRNSFPFSTR
jgi:hypothetical protein